MHIYSVLNLVDRLEIIFENKAWGSNSKPSQLNLDVKKGCSLRIWNLEENDRLVFGTMTMNAKFCVASTGQFRDKD